jgi:hypothetical protein
MKKKKQTRVGRQAAASAAACAASVSSPKGIVPRSVSNPNILDQGRIFKEAILQTQPLAVAGSPEAAQAAAAIEKATALPKGLKPVTCKRLVTSSQKVSDLIKGANPKGKAAEIVAAADFRAKNAGHDSGMTNPPGKASANLHDMRLSPDQSSRQDFVVLYRSKNGTLITAPYGQVKTGSNRYVVEKLVEMAHSPGYGKTGIIDARFVNQDGTPRVAANGFTEAEARRLSQAKVRLRGIRDLDLRSEKLVDDIAQHSADKLDPVTRHQLKSLRDDIARAYSPKSVSGRIAGGAAAAAATAAIVTLVVQVASGGEVSFSTIGDAAKNGALFGGGGAAADALIYHGSTKLAGVAPEAAKAAAGTAVAAGFCLLAIGTDVFSEIKAAHNEELSTANAVAGSSAKIALDLLPLLLVPLGIFGVPILIGAQLGGRWAIAKVRHAEHKLETSIAEDFETIYCINARIHQLSCRTTAALQRRNAANETFRSVMAKSPRRLRLLSN